MDFLIVLIALGYLVFSIFIGRFLFFPVKELNKQNPESEYVIVDGARYSRDEYFALQMDRLIESGNKSGAVVLLVRELNKKD